ncbi:hypothetical protein CPC08DRAFT_729945 [Agrocybe pediades]|nr:hypothetical protein CPC08DRAFT_729945 [Agrocybe pediades]
MANFDPSLYVRATKKAGEHSHQEDYRAAGSAAQRRQVIVQHVCPKLFTYWQEECGTLLDDRGIETRVKDLLAYVRNSWRPTKSTRERQPTFVVKRSDVVWDTMQDKVMSEVARLMGKEHVDTSTKGWFSKRSKAIGNVIKGLSQEEVVALEAEVQRRTNQGNPDHLKVKLAKKYRWSRTSAAARRNYLEMGLLSLNFVAYKDEDGVYGLDIHDNMHQLLGVEDTTFEMESPSIVMAFKRQVLARLKRLLAKRDGEALPKDTSAYGYDHYIEIDPATGCPCLKDTFRALLKPKKMLERLFRRYLTLQYHLATGRHDPVPYSKVLQKINTFIDPKYLPPGFKFRDPRNVNGNEIQSFFEHIYERQQFCTIDDVFRFKKVTKSRNEGDIIVAPYPPLPASFHITNAAEGPMNAEEVAPDHLEKRSRSEVQAEKRKQPTIGQIIQFKDLYSISPTAREATLPPSTNASAAGQSMGAQVTSAPAPPSTATKTFNRPTLLAKDLAAQQLPSSNHQFTEEGSSYLPSPTHEVLEWDYEQSHHSNQRSTPPLDPFIINESQMQIQNAQFQPIVQMARTNRIDAPGLPIHADPAAIPTVPAPGHINNPALPTHTASSGFPGLPPLFNDLNLTADMPAGSMQWTVVGNQESVIPFPGLAAQAVPPTQALPALNILSGPAVPTVHAASPAPNLNPTPNMPRPRPKPRPKTKESAVISNKGNKRDTPEPCTQPDKGLNPQQHGKKRKGGDDLALDEASRLSDLPEKRIRKPRVRND